MPIHDTEASTRVLRRLIRVVWMMAVTDRLQTMQRALVLTRLHLVAHQLRLARRLASVLCEVERVRLMRRRRQVLQRVRRLWHRVVLLRTHRLRLRLQRRRVVRRLMRQQRLLVRRRVVLCCLVVVARRRLARRLVMVLVVLEGRLNLRAWLRVRLWLVVVDQRMRRVRQLRRQRSLEVAVIVRCNRRQARRLVRLCHRVVGQHQMRRMLLCRRLVVLVLLLMRLRRSAVRRQVQQWCMMVAVRVMLLRLLVMQRSRLVDLQLHR